MNAHHRRAVVVAAVFAGGLTATIGTVAAGATPVAPHWLTPGSAVIEPGRVIPCRPIPILMPQSGRFTGVDRTLPVLAGGKAILPSHTIHLSPGIGAGDPPITIHPPISIDPPITIHPPVTLDPPVTELPPCPPTRVPPVTAPPATTPPRTPPSSTPPGKGTDPTPDPPAHAVPGMPTFTG